MIKLLIVDDAKFMRMMIKKLLENSDIEIVGEAENGEDALEKYKTLKPDVVTMDITMPKVDGLMGVKIIRDFDPNAKILMVSAMGQEAMVREAIASGAKGFIVKPFKEDVLISTIQNVHNKTQNKKKKK